ncbi:MULTISPECIES: hypothetical protein [Streptomyces]|uniref:hypothetical protein n=1 Tax=Streptomyces TaxID=1883 RepID=UPI0018DF0813|nr:MULTISPECIES: hypothetical protein [Streptomyces]MCZ4098484.1 hypothetical protein [Streptomyces sp. H39-C1]
MLNDNVKYGAFKDFDQHAAACESCFLARTEIIAIYASLVILRVELRRPAAAAVVAAITPSGRAD